MFSNVASDLKAEASLSLWARVLGLPWASRLLVAFAVVSAISSILLIGQIGLLSGYDGSAAVGDQILGLMDLEELVFLIGFALLIASYVFVLVWMYDASNNLKALGVTNQRHPASAAVYWWFVPVALLFKPYQVMKELWQESCASPTVPMTATPVEEKPVSNVLGWWWAAWLAFGLSAIGYRRLAANEPTDASWNAYADFLLGLAWIDLVSSLAGIAAAILLSILVRDITRHQRTRLASQVTPT